MHSFSISSLERAERARGHRQAHAGLAFALALSVAAALAPAGASAQDDFDPQDVDPEAGLVEEAAPEPEAEAPPPVQAADEESAFDAGDPSLDEPEEEPIEDSGGALILAAKFGGGVPFNDLDLSIAGALEVGYLFSRTGTSLGVLLDVSYFVPQSDGTATDTRLSSAMDGSYSWHAWQKELSFQPTLLYRMTFLSRMVVPYVGAGPRIYLLETVVDGKAGDASFPISREVSTKVGFGVPLGAEITLGPGGVIAELLFQWGPLKHEITGDTHLASSTLWVGYRALL